MLDQVRVMMGSSQTFSSSQHQSGSADYHLRTLAQLFKLDLQDMFTTWDTSKPIRAGMPHASAILAPENEWCVRRHVLSALYPEAAERAVPKPWGSHTNAVFLNGWHLHEKYQQLLSTHGQVLEVETAHYDETRMLHFTPDAIVLFDGQPYVVEIKGYCLESYNRLDEAGEPPQAAHHQANFYCHLLGIEHALILVECKNTQEFKVWCIQHDAALARVYLDRCYAIKGAITTKSLPSRTCSSCRDRLAEKCPMRTLCFRLEK